MLVLLLESEAILVRSALRLDGSRAAVNSQLCLPLESPSPAPYGARGYTIRALSRELCSFRERTQAPVESPVAEAARREQALAAWAAAEAALVSCPTIHPEWLAGHNEPVAINRRLG